MLFSRAHDHPNNCCSAFPLSLSAVCQTLNCCLLSWTTDSKLRSWVGWLYRASFPSNTNWGLSLVVVQKHCLFFTPRRPFFELRDCYISKIHCCKFLSRRDVTESLVTDYISNEWRDYVLRFRGNTTRSKIETIPKKRVVHH